MPDKKEVKESSWLLNLFMLIVGAISIMLDVTARIFLYFGQPSWWPFTGPATAVFSWLVGGTIIGVWMFIGALGLWKEKAWALGVAFVCFTLILGNGLIGVISAIIAEPINFWMFWADYVALIMVVFSAVGFIYLLITRNRYH
nr:hypothetical protein [Candidatus Sigynarchaeota archaeon]